MKPLSTWPLDDRQRIKGIFTDIDDTLTTDGAITPDALAALYELKAQGISVSVIAITGRPVGWSEPFALSWPVDAIVAENGAILLQNTYQNSLKPKQIERRQLSKSYQHGYVARASNCARMQQSTIATA